jgi:hypothetical protein
MKPGNRGPYVAAGIVAALSLGFQLPIFDRWISHMDEGHMLLFADLFAHGRFPYRDATLLPLPGAFYLLSLVFELFGTSILVSRFFVMLEFTAFVVLVTLLMRKRTSAGGAAAVVVALLVYRIWAFPHWQMYSYSTTALLVLVAAVHCQLRWFAVRRTGWLVAAGLLFGFGVFCKQDYGAAFLLVMAATFVAEGRSRGLPVLRPLGVFLAAGGAVGAAAGLYFAFHGVLPVLLRQTVFVHFAGIGAFEYTSYPPLFPLFAQDPAIRDAGGIFAFFPGIVTTVDLETLRQDPLFRDTFLYDVALKLFYWGPYPFALFALLRVLRRRPRLGATAGAPLPPAFLVEATLAGLSATFLLLLTLNRPQDFLHAAVLVWPMLCLGVVYVHELVRSRRMLGLALCGVLALPSLAVLGYSVRAYLLLREQYSERLDDARAGVRVRPSQAALMRSATAFLREGSQPGEPVLAVPYLPILHFLADRPGPHHAAYIVWPFAEIEERDRRIIEAVEALGTKTGVYNLTEFSVFPPMSQFAPELFRYLVDHFEMAGVFGYETSGMQVVGLRRSAQVEGPSPLLDAGWQESAVRIDSDDAPPLALTPSEREGMLRREAWPFRRALALRPSAWPRQTVLRVPLPAARAGDVLRTAVGLHPDFWFAVPSFETRFEIAIETRETAEPGSAAREVVYVRTLDPHRELGDRGWFEVEVPLAAWSGRDAWLELSLSVDSSAGELARVGGFAEPRIVASVGPADAPDAMAD